MRATRAAARAAPAAQSAALAGALELEVAAPQARLAIGAALLGLLALAAEEQPVLCVVDDLQWVDEPSLEALRFAVRRLGAEGVAVLLGQRTAHGELAPGSGHSTLTRPPRRRHFALLGPLPEPVAQR